MRKFFRLNISYLIIPIYFISVFTVGHFSKLLAITGVSAPVCNSLKLLLSSPLTWLIAYLYIRMQNPEFCYNTKFRNKHYIPLLCLGSIGIQYGVIAPVVSLIPMIPSVTAIMEKAFTIIPLMSVITSLVIISPIFEELIYRGLVLDSLLKKQKRWTAITLSSFIYAIIHMNPHQFFAVFLLGLFIGWTYSYTRNISACILIHFIVNTSEVSISYLKNPDNMAHDLIATSIDWDSRITIVFTAISLIIALFSIYELNTFYKSQFRDLEHKAL
ncbi:MAG: lysostaphin resistance A-like protein [Bacteroidales bacterium]